MIIFRFIYYVLLKPIGRVVFDLPDYEPKKSTTKAKSTNNHSSHQNTNHQKSESLLKGHAFEEFIATKVSKNRAYKLKEWRGDKYANGIYAESNLFPDLEFELTAGSKEYRFAIECKWRNNFYEGRLELFKETQLKNYWRYSAERKIIVFVAIGVGIEDHHPRELYIIPLSKIHSTHIFKSDLNHYRYQINDEIKFDPIHQGLFPSR
jgi:hypothetical protein